MRYRRRLREGEHRADTVEGMSPATGTAIALMLAWGVGEIAWLLVDRATPDPMGTPGDERDDLHG